MITLSPIASNLSVVIISKPNSQTKLYFSYETCVAIRHIDFKGNEHKLRRAAFFSATTSRHLNKIGAANWEGLSDTEFDAYLTILT